MTYNTNIHNWTELLDQPYGVMDLRGAAQVTDNSFIICGGMIADQVVSNKAFLITLDFASGIDELDKESV